jgi:N-acetylglucosaminyldiphosphoundecaprenol N-acetyl-beta-D-mannosaminyltransferase
MRGEAVTVTDAMTTFDAPALAPGQSRIFDIPIDLARPADMLRRITSWATEPAQAGEARRVMYVNAHVLNQSAEIPELRDALGRADLVYCDGYGVRLAAKALETEIPHRMTGADWIWGLSALCEAQGRSLYLLGSEPGVAAQAADRLRSWYPGLQIAGHHHGYFETGSPHDERVVEDINAKRPDIVLVGMGSPKQELWVERHVDEVETSVVWTVGALFDYVSGRVPRAPAWLADNGLEWIFRFAMEPQRMWRRYLVGNPQFVSRVMTHAKATRATGGPLAG